MIGLAPGEVAALFGVFVGLGLWIWALVDCARRCPRESRGRWIIVIALLNAAGALLYLIFRHSLLSRPGDDREP